MRPESDEVRQAAARDRAPGASQLEEIRRRVVSGAYESPEVMKRVARRILDRNDL